MFRLEDYPFPMEDPEAGQLVKTMANLYVDKEKTYESVATWIARIDIEERDTPYERWLFLLKKLANLGKLREFVKAAHDAHSGNLTVVSFLGELLKRPKYDL